MASFICKAMTPQGQIVKFKMAEESKILCLKKIKSNGMTPISVENTLGLFNKKSKINSAMIYSKRKKIENNFKIKFNEKITLGDLKNFTQDFYLLKKSKFTNEHALSTIINDVENEDLKIILRNILKNLQNGKFMYKTMEEYSNIFPSVYINFIKTGEITGFLEDSLGHAIEYLKYEESLKNKIQKELIPNITMFFGILIMIIISIFIVVPVLQDLFLSNGNNIILPNSIIILNSIIGSIVKHWFLILVFIILIITFFIRYINTYDGKLKFDNLKYNNFLCGKMLYLLDFSRLIRYVYMNLKNKMRIQDALEVSKNVINNTYMLNTIESSISNVYIGKSWVEPFKKDKKLSPIVIEILKKATRNKLDDSIEKTIEYLDFEIENQKNKLQKRLSELSYLIVGSVLLLFTIIILIPCIQVYLSGFLII